MPTKSKIWYCGLKHIDDGKSVILVREEPFEKLSEGERGTIWRPLPIRSITAKAAARKYTRGCLGLTILEIDDGWINEDDLKDKRLMRSLYQNLGVKKLVDLPKIITKKKKHKKHNRTHARFCRGKRK